MRALLAILLTILVLLQLKLWFGEGGFRDVQRAGRIGDLRRQAGQGLRTRGGQAAQPPEYQSYSNQPVHSINDPANGASTVLKIRTPTLTTRQAPVNSS